MREFGGKAMLLFAALGLLGAAVSACETNPAASSPTSRPAPAASAPTVTLHYAANGNLGTNGEFPPGDVGFNMADVGSKQQLDALPAGVSGLVYLGLCEGADANFRARVDPYAGDPKLFGFYLLDEPDPASCAAANLAAESSYIHAHIPGAKTFILEQNLASSRSPTYAGGYNVANTGLDLIGIDPYPCRSELNGCDFSLVGSYVAAAINNGIPAAVIVPVFQTFGGGTWVDDGDGSYLMPTPEQATRLLQEWAKVIPHPVFDYAYSWGSQRGDTALGLGSPALQQVFATHNRK